MNKLGHVFRCINALNMLRHLLDTCLHLNMYTDTIDTIQEVKNVQKIFEGINFIIQY